ncbi:MAG: transposase, partial [Oscillospiraceae bacterium]
GYMELLNRKSTRLANYDYSNENYYFITICTHNRQMLFGNVGNGLDHSEIKLNHYGEIAKNELLNIPNHFEGVRIDKYVIMPDHIHAIIVIGCDGKTERSRPFPTLSAIVGLYKSGVSKLIHEIEPDIKIWQKSFNDRIIRNEQGYREVWQYIEENSLKWDEDCFYHAQNK